MCIAKNNFTPSFVNIKTGLQQGQTINNWTVAKGYLGQSFDIVEISEDYIVVKPLSASAQKIAKEDFNKVILVWESYLLGKTPRHYIRDNTRYSKYIISILHHISEQQST